MTSTAPGAATFELAPFLERERERVNAVLAHVAAELADDAPPALRDPIRYALDTPGKRLRPILCITAWRACGGELDERVYRLAAALEIVHTYSLVHDDLPCMDNDDLRRGRPTLHRAFDVRTATLAGAALIPAAIRVLDDAAAALGLAPPRRAELLAELCAASGARGMVGGQLLDLLAEDRATGPTELEAIHRRKTGALLAASLRIGAIAAAASPEVVASLSVYGEAVGLAFQIVDDVLDVTASADALGKTAGKDESVGKATYPALFGIDGARVLAGEHIDEAIGALHSAAVVSPELEALARFILERGH